MAFCTEHTLLFCIFEQNLGRKKDTIGGGLHPWKSTAGTLKNHPIEKEHLPNLQIWVPAVHFPRGTGGFEVCSQPRRHSLSSKRGKTCWKWQDISFSEMIHFTTTKTKMAMEKAAWMKMYFLLKMEILQLVMLVFSGVYLWVFGFWCVTSNLLVVGLNSARKL